MKALLIVLAVLGDCAGAGVDYACRCEPGFDCAATGECLARVVLGGVEHLADEGETRCGLAVADADDAAVGTERCRRCWGP